MIPVKLPVFPKEKEFEEYISAFLQSGGFYVERNIIERDVEEVLELDIIATDYKVPLPNSLLVEVKSGKWGFPDLFKLKGWMAYLGISKAIFIAKDERDKGNTEFFKEKAALLGIDLIVISNLPESRSKLSLLINPEYCKDLDINAWRFSNWVERNLLDRLNALRKSDRSNLCYGAVKDYFFNLNNEIFFIEDLSRKVLGLYSAFQKNPRISAKCAYELMGRNFNENYTDMPEEIYSDTYYKCSFNIIQISTFIEYRARLAILKNAVEYIINAENGAKSKKSNSWKDPENLFPSSFEDALSSIRDDEYLPRYPIFWQWFLWIFGGFILKDYQETELEILSQKTGIPIEEIPNAFECFELLFPLKGGWFMNLHKSNIKVMKLFSVPFMGIGANYRRWLYTENYNFEELRLTGSNTLSDLIKWNELLINILSFSNLSLTTNTQTGAIQKMKTSNTSTDGFSAKYSSWDIYDLKSFHES